MSTAKAKKKKVPGAKTEKQKVQELLDQADGILQEVDESLIIKTSGPRQFPSFERKELKFGAVLGVGGFCLVREVRQVELTDSGGPDGDGAIVEPSRADVPEEAHYEVSTARCRMAKYCLRDGDARYAVKQLHADLSELETARGMIDLAIEAKYLSVVSHPNIIKMRATASCGPMNKGYYLVLDRLYGTLKDKIGEWKKDKRSSTGLFRKREAKKEGLRDLIVDRLLVAYDLASAFQYLHQNKLVYRDIKSENIGFDVRGDVKVFNFGLCKNLSPKLKAGSNGMYKLTPRTGSFPYMAPEVAQCKPYSHSADVFSFAMLLWEILKLKLPFKGFTKKEYYEKITVQGLRPPVEKSWPPMTTAIMKEAWDADPKKRPDLKRVVALIRTDLGNLIGEDEVLNRMHQMMQRSRRSFYGSGSVRGILAAVGKEEPAVGRRRSSFARHKSTTEMHGKASFLEET